MQTYKITVRAWEKNHTFRFKTDSLTSAIKLARKETLCSDAVAMAASIEPPVTLEREWWHQMNELD